MRVIAAVTIALLLITTAAAEIEFRDDEDIQYHTGIDMNQNPLIGLPDPQADSEPVPFGFLSQQYVAREGDSMEGNLEMQNNQIIGNSGQIDFESSQISDIKDISDLQFLVPDQGLQIAGDTEFLGNLNIKPGGLNGQRIRWSEGIDGEGRSEFINIPVDSTSGDEIVLISKRDETDQDQRVMGTLYYGRTTGSSAPYHSKVDFYYNQNDAGDLADFMLESIDDRVPQGSGENYVEPVSVEYNGEVWAGIRIDQGWGSIDWRTAEIHYLSNYNTSNLVAADREDVSNLQEWGNIANYPYKSVFADIRTGGDLQIAGDTEIDEDLDVEGEASFGDEAPVQISGEERGDNLVRARNFGETPSGVSQYLVGQSGDRSLRWRDNLVSVYDSLQVGDGYGNNNPDYTLDIHGDSRFRDNIDLDGNDVTGLDFLGASGDLEIGADIDLLGNDLDNGGTAEFDDLTLGSGGANFDSSGVAADYYQDHDVGPVSSNTRHAILLHESDSEKTMGQIEMFRYSGSRGRYLGNMDIIAQTERNTDDSGGNTGRTRFAIEANEARSTTPWEIGYAEYDGTEYVVLVYTSGNNEYTQNAKFNGYNSDGGPELIQYYDEDDDECLEDEICDTIEKADISDASDDIDRLTIGASQKEFYQSDVIVHEDFEVFGSKDFVHPINDTHEAVYTAQESDDVRAVNEESAEIGSSGEKVVELPDHFSQVVSDDDPDLKIQLTPHEYLEGSLGVTQRNKTHFTVQGPENQTTKFDYRITGIREGYEDKETVRDR